MQLAYAIGVAQPVSVLVDTFATGIVEDSQLTKLLCDSLDLTPAGIIQKLELRRPIYGDTARYGHFGRQELPWEQTDLAQYWKSAGLFL